MVCCFVVLHYKTAEDTIECVNSMLGCEMEPDIVIVDNASNNGSIELVEKEFENSRRVHIIKNQQNLGFASGNNVGYRYARKTLHADFIAISNNDIIVETSDIFEQIIRLYDTTKFYVMGPDIRSLKDDGHQNPIIVSFTSKKQVRLEILRYRILLLLSRIGIYDILKPGKQVRTGSTRNTIPKTTTEDVALHGSFVVFSPAFIKGEKIAFREGTFLYTEEAILRRYCQIHHYKMIFEPTIKVLHKEDSATNSLKLTNRKKREFVFKNMIRSLSVYLKYL